jgi:hypothetical protein
MGLWFLSRSFGGSYWDGLLMLWWLIGGMAAPALCGGSCNGVSGSLGVVVVPRIVAPLKRWWLLGGAGTHKGVWLLGVWQLLVNVAMAQRRCGNSLDVCKYWFWNRCIIPNFNIPNGRFSYVHYSYTAIFLRFKIPKVQNS